MGNWLRRSPLSRVGAALLWTAALIGLLYGTDRVFLGPGTFDWTQAPELAAMPAAAGRVLVPAYLPDTVRWPPQRVVYRTGETPGWWLGFAGSQSDTVQLWIGVGDSPVPAELGALGECLVIGTRQKCPSDWRALSTRVPPGQTLHIVGALGSVQMARILDGLGRAAGPRP